MNALLVPPRGHRFEFFLSAHCLNPAASAVTVPGSPRDLRSRRTGMPFSAGRMVFYIMVGLEGSRSESLVTLPQMRPCFIALTFYENKFQQTTR